MGSEGFWLVPEHPIGKTYDAPFKLSNSAGANTLVIGSAAVGKTDFVGIGTNAPESRLDVRGAVSASWKGSSTAGDGTKRLLELKADNQADGKVSGVGFNLENKKVGFSWTFRTIEGTQGFAANKKGTGGAEVTFSNTGSDYRDVVVKFGDTVVYRDGALVIPVVASLEAQLKEKDQQIAALQESQQTMKMQYDALMIAQNGRQQALEAKLAKLEALQERLAQLESILINVAAAKEVKKGEAISVK